MDRSDSTQTKGATCLLERLAGIRGHDRERDSRSTIKFQTMHQVPMSNLPIDPGTRSRRQRRCLLRGLTFVTQGHRTSGKKGLHPRIAPPTQLRPPNLHFVIVEDRLQVRLLVEVDLSMQEPACDDVQRVTQPRLDVRRVRRVRVQCGEVPGADLRREVARLGGGVGGERGGGHGRTGPVPQEWYLSATKCRWTK